MHTANWRRVDFKVDQNNAFELDLLAVDQISWARFRSTPELMSSSIENKSSALIICRNPIIMKLFSHQKNARLYNPLVDSEFAFWYSERRIFRFSVASVNTAMSLTNTVQVKTAAIGLGASSIHSVLA
jgi:hypothetical protein